MFITLIVLVLILLVQCNIFMIVDANSNVDDILDHHRPRRNLKRLAMLWTIERSPGFYFDFALSSFVGSGADMVMFKYMFQILFINNILIINY